jgi:hypothetical protein
MIIIKIKIKKIIIRDDYKILKYFELKIIIKLIIDVYFIN